jgi:hypothetical protein
MAAWTTRPTTRACSCSIKPRLWRNGSKAQANAHHAFVIVGDWNRDLEEELAGHYPARTDGSIRRPDRACTRAQSVSRDQRWRAASEYDDGFRGRPIGC